jgi:hypothetical protein
MTNYSTGCDQSSNYICNTYHRVNYEYSRDIIRYFEMSQFASLYSIKCVRRRKSSVLYSCVMGITTRIITTFATDFTSWVIPIITIHARLVFSDLNCSRIIWIDVSSFQKKYYLSHLKLFNYYKINKNKSVGRKLGC